MLRAKLASCTVLDAGELTVEEGVVAVGGLSDVQYLTRWTELSKLLEGGQLPREVI